MQNRETKTLQTSGMQVDYLEIVFALIRRWWIIVIALLLGGAIAFSYAAYGITPLYSASTMLYVNTSPLDSAKISLATTNLSLSRSFVDTYLVILRSRTTLEKVIERTHLNYSYGALRGMISAGSVDGTEIFSVTVKCPSPEEAELIADTIGQVLPEVMSSIIEGTSVRIVDYAVIPSEKTSPDVSSYTFKGMAIGAALAAALIALFTLLDYKVHTEEYLMDNYPEMPLLALVPDITSNYKKGYYYARYQHYEPSEDKKNSDKKTNAKEKGKDKDGHKKARLRLIGSNLNFAAKEAYKRLRVNLDYALADVPGCRVLGITSSMRGEGKSLTAINLTYCLAEAGNRVLLVEGDMRLPTLAYKLRLVNKLGLSNIFTGEVTPDEVIQNYEMTEKNNVKVNFDLLAAGSIPPNPSELLGSQKMRDLLEDMKARYDYIILDLPPVIAVSDALVAAKLLHGIVFVVRQDYSEKGAIADAMRQMSFANVNILGCTFNCMNEAREGYLSRYRYHYGRKYYRGGYGYNKKYGYSSYGYGDGSYEQSAQQAQQTQQGDGHENER